MAALLLAPFLLAALPGAPAGTVLGSGVDAEFHLALGRHYGTSTKVVMALHSQGVSDDEMPVVLCLASRARVEPKAVLALRAKGKSWMDITLHFGLDAGIFHVHFEKDPGPPYGKAWGYYKNHPKDRWREIRLADAEIVGLVQLRFLSHHHGIAPHLVLESRGKGTGFLALHAKLKAKGKARASPGKAAKPAAGPAKGKPSKGRGKGRGKK